MASVLMLAASALLTGTPRSAAGHDGLAPASDFHALPEDGPAYPVSGLRLQIVSNAPDHEALAKLPELRLRLGQVAHGFVAPGGMAPDAEVPLVVAPYTNYHRSALQAISKQIVAYLTDEGFDEVLVYPVEEEIDPETGVDLRGVGQLRLHLLVRANREPGGWFDW